MNRHVKKDLIKNLVIASVIILFIFVPMVIVLFNYTDFDNAFLFVIILCILFLAMILVINVLIDLEESRELHLDRF